MTRFTLDLYSFSVSECKPRAPEQNPQVGRGNKFYDFNKISSVNGIKSISPHWRPLASLLLNFLQFLDILLIDLQVSRTKKFRHFMEK